MEQKFVMLAGVGAIVLGSGCGGDEIAERIVEDRIEADGGGDVDIDIDDGEISVKGDDGDFTIKTDEDGNVSVQGSGSADGGSFTLDADDGETVVETEDGRSVFSQGGELPEGFPAQIPVPDDLEIVFAQSSDTPDGQGFAVAATSARGVDELIDEIVSGLEAAGYDEQLVTSTEDGSILIYRGPDHSVTVTVGSGNDGETTVSLTVMPGT